MEKMLRAQYTFFFSRVSSPRDTKLCWSTLLGVLDAFVFSKTQPAWRVLGVELMYSGTAFLSLKLVLNPRFWAMAQESWLGNIKI